MDLVHPDSVIDHHDPVALRELLGRFCSGITVVATEGAAGVAGFACQWFRRHARGHAGDSVRGRCRRRRRGVPRTGRRAGGLLPG
ncbi:hypothetical protein [Dietzia lutea]|uniref:Flavin reductase like domain-containing protein n=1 Tax=Dietzia lutea TaxID=546160 RepID=A0A2S1R3R6_9ACTN|nr:hypothetical protein [Dietzia lutea]AWH90892.1 hypothetical protein A6035_00405 [Dietzia lutea]